MVGCGSELWSWGQERTTLWEILQRLLGASNGSDDLEETLSIDRRRKSEADEVIIGGASAQRRCKAGALERTPRPDSLDGSGVGAGVGSSPFVDKSFFGLSERGGASAMEV